MKKSPYYIYGNACDCKYCNGHVPKKIYDDYERYHCGGRKPFIIDYDPNKVKLVWISAKGNPYPENIPSNYYYKTSVPASVHGCWKVKKHQKVEIWLKRKDTDKPTLSEVINNV